MTVVAYVLLAIGVAVTLMSCVGVLVMPNVFDRLHYTSPATTLGVFAIALAVVVEEGWSAASVKSMLVFALLVVTGSVVTHATAGRRGSASSATGSPCAPSGSRKPRQQR